MLVIIGSRRFSEEIHDLQSYLTDNRVDVVSAPYPDIVYDDSLTSQWANKGLIYDHLLNIERANRCLIYNPNGYVGVNTILEVGYFINKRKPLYACEKTGEPCIDMFVSHFANSSDAKKLLEILNKKD